MIFFVGVFTYLCACHPAKNALAFKPDQAIIGQVLEKKGNQMPSPGKQNYKGKPYNSIVYIFEPSSIQDAVTLEGNLFKKLNTKLIGSYPTDSLGNFFIKIKPGLYSILVGYQDAFYAPFFSGKNEIAVIKVQSGLNTTLDIVINSSAAY